MHSYRTSTKISHLSINYPLLQKHDIIHICLEEEIDETSREKYVKQIQKKYTKASQYLPGSNSLHKTSVDITLLKIPYKEIIQHCSKIIMILTLMILLKRTFLY